MYEISFPFPLSNMKKCRRNKTNAFRFISAVIVIFYLISYVLNRRLMDCQT